MRITTIGRETVLKLKGCFIADGGLATENIGNKVYLLLLHIGE